MEAETPKKLVSGTLSKAWTGRMRLGSCDKFWEEAFCGTEEGCSVEETGGWT